MARIPVLLMLLPHWTGSLSQPMLTQPPSLSATLGTTTRFTCTLSSGFSAGDYIIFGYQQQPWSLLQYLLYYYSDSIIELGFGVPSHFSVSKDWSANAGLLLISGLQPEDEADYYCASEHSSENSYHWSQCLRQQGSESKTSGPTVPCF
ncbi:unnamed protein product [Gulo gulo]|uniref:Ig-like domain-containing protein n=1 Tax=Gulo gulo TaxID=48420 RepID=A0A9X9LLP8_GULGU|nr:unnamed protein product [Gulo gulo]